MGFEEFCGGDVWSNTTTWYTTTPDFTLCFQWTILSWLPTTFLLAASPFEISGWFQSNCPRIPFTVLNIVKLLVSLGLVAVCVAEIVLLNKINNDVIDIPDAAMVGEAVMIVGYLLSGLLLILSLR